MDTAVKDISKQAFKVTDIIWDLHDIKGITLLPDVKTLPESVTIMLEDTDYESLPDVDSYTYEAELEWLIGGYLFDNYGWLTDSFVVTIIDVV